MEWQAVPDDETSGIYLVSLVTAFVHTMVTGYRVLMTTL